MAEILDVIEGKSTKMYVDFDGWTVEDLAIVKTTNAYALIKEIYTSVAKANVSDVKKVGKELEKLYGNIEVEKIVILESTLEEVQAKYDEALSFHEIEDEIVDVVFYAGQTIFLRQQPYLAGTHENPYFEASAFDTDGNEIVAVWEINNHEADDEFEMVDDWNKVSVYRKI